MNAWRLSREPAVSARLAVPTDRAALSALLARTWRRHGNVSTEDQVALLANGLSAIVSDDEEAVGFLGVDLRAPTGVPEERWADVQLVAVEATRRGEGALNELIQVTLSALRVVGCTATVSLTPPGWLAEGMSKAGFRTTDQVVTYVRKEERSTPESAGAARLRSAGVPDATVVLAINTRAFEPVWRYDDGVIISWLMTADRAVIAEVNGQPAGFALTTDGLPGNYAHLIRVATDPAFQGRGIGRQLVADAIRHVHERGAAGLALNTQQSNMVSRRLYESLGFKLTGHTLSVLVRRI